MISGLYSCIHPYINKQTGVVFTCGQCALCRRRKAQEWIMRCSHELQTSKVATFLTLTYKPRNLRVSPVTRPENAFDKCGTLYERDMQLFFKRLRKRGYKFKYFYCGEYGSSKWRPHYHCVLFGLSPFQFMSDDCDIESIWSLGHVDVSFYSATEKSIAYIVGYVSKKMCNYREKELRYINNGRVAPYLRCSKGLGAEWSDIHLNEWIESLTVGFNGRQMSVPRYYILRQFSKEGLSFKRVTEIRHADGGSHLSKQKVIIKNPYGDISSRLLSSLHRQRCEYVDKLFDYPISDSAKSVLSDRYRDYSLSLLYDVYRMYDYYSDNLPSVEYRIKDYRVSSSTPLLLHPLLSSCENAESRRSVMYKLLKISRGIGNHHEFFDVAMDLEEIGL